MRSAAAALRRFARRHPSLAAAPRDDSACAAPLAVAFSGGADSTALLLAARRVWPRRQLLALHVHHGLQAAADGFAEHARAQCMRWGIDCHVLEVRVALRRGDSLEEQARTARHARLQRAACELGCDWLLLGHQADDQAESLLLALLRGAGPAGLAAMPEAVLRGGVQVGRPLLDCAAQVLRAELDAAGIDYVRDPMNADPALRRSRIRHQLLPVIDALEPGWRRTLARSASLCAQAAQALHERAAQDLQLCRAAAGLRVSALALLEPSRRAEALRAWLLEHGLRSNAAQLDNLCRQLQPGASAGLRAGVGRARLWRDGDVLRCDTGSGDSALHL